MDNSTPYKAIEYDAKVRHVLPYYDTIHTQVIKLLKVVKPEAVGWLDTGCGTGRLIQQAWPLFPQTRFLLTDPSATMLEQARERLADMPAGRLTVLPPGASAELPPCVPGLEVEVITAILCHHYLRPPGRLQALRACFNLLRPEGLLITFEHIAPRTPQGVQYGLAVWREFLVRHGKTGAEADRHLARYNTEFFPLTVEQHLQVLAEVGFGTVEVFWYSHMQAGFYGQK